MDIINKSRIKQKVTSLLFKSKRLRDNTNELVLAYYYEHGDDTEFSQWYCEHKSLTTSIERYSRLLQNQFKNLRGANWSKRKQHQVSVRKDINK